MKSLSKNPIHNNATTIEEEQTNHLRQYEISVTFKTGTFRDLQAEKEINLAGEVGTFRWNVSDGEPTPDPTNLVNEIPSS